MADFATLVLGAETAGLKKAEPALDAVIAKAGKADAAAAKLGASAKAMGTAAQTGANQAKAALTGIESEAQQAAVAVEKTSASLDGMAVSAARAGNAANASAGQVGNLTAQVFDITMMMQAGQNPFQLMLQQGSQVAQVLGPMGASGALQAFKGVFMQLLSPVNLATFAVIGLTAAVVPMVVEFFKGADAAKALEETTKSLADATEAYRAAVTAANAPILELGKNYGALTMAATEALRIQSQLAETTALDLLQQKVAMLSTTFGGLEDSLFGLGASEAATAIYQNFDLTAEATNGLLESLRELAAAEGPAQIAAEAAELRSELEAAFGAASEMPPPIRQLYEELNTAVLEAANLQGGFDEAARAAEAVDRMAAQINSTIASADGSALHLAFASAFPAANQLLGIANNIIAVLNSGSARAAQMQFDKGNKQYGGRGGDPRAFMNPEGSGPFVPSAGVVKAADAMLNPKAAGGGGGGGGGGRSEAAKEAEKEAEAIQKVIDKLKSETEQVGMTAEARRLHQELQRAGVDIYSKEGQQIAALVEELTLLEAKQKLVAETMKGIENAAQGFFVGVLSGAKDLGSAIGDLLRQLGNLFLNQAFKMLWDGKPGGKGGLGGLFAGLFDMGGRIPAGQVGLVAEKRPEVVDGRLITRPTLVPGPANVKGGAATSRMMGVPGPQGASPARRTSQAMSAPRVSVAPAPVIVLDDPRKIDAFQRSPQGERAAAWQKRRMGNG